VIALKSGSDRLPERARLSRSKAPTSSQAGGLIKEFDSIIYPTLLQNLSTPLSRDDTSTDLEYKAENNVTTCNFQGEGGHIVTLVDRSSRWYFYDPTADDGRTYLADFLDSLYNDLSGHNVMTINAYDWLHRTGESLPDDYEDPAYIACGLEQTEAPLEREVWKAAPALL
jgi:hypothetical protein